ncbi:MAG TPA: hypothetical protein VG055_31725 [Planctomycetaceae bacterium]|jgi:hypothetical protein|nr:hypothetical protein [Planctomycetaceae bacterium]
MPTAFRATVAVFGICLAFAVPGCGNSSTAKNTPAQPAVAANADEQAEAPAEKPAAKVEKKPEAKPAPPVARRRPQDPTKWELADLKSGLSAHDARFLMAVVAFTSKHPNDAEDLRALLERAGQLKDDSSITLPLAPAPTTATAAKPVTPPTASTPPAKAAAGLGRGMRRKGGKMGGGLGSE